MAMNIGISWLHQTVVCIHGMLSQRTSDLRHTSTAWFVVKNLVFVLLTAIVAAALGKVKIFEFFVHFNHEFINPRLNVNWNLMLF